MQIDFSLNYYLFQVYSSYFAFIWVLFNQFCTQTLNSPVGYNSTFFFFFFFFSRKKSTTEKVALEKKTEGYDGLRESFTSIINQNSQWSILVIKGLKIVFVCS